MRALGQAMKGALFAYLLTVVPMNIAVYRGRGRLFRHLESLWLSLVLFIFVGIFVAILGLILGIILRIAGIKVPDVLLYILFVLILPVLGYRLGVGMAYDDHNWRRGRHRHERGTVVSAVRSLGRPLWGRGTRADRQRKADLVGLITLAGIPLRPSEETKHFKFIGTTGT